MGALGPETRAVSSLAFWVLPGGEVRLGRLGNGGSLEDTAGEVVGKLTGGARPRYLHQVKTYSDPGRAPRQRVLSTAFVATLDRPPPLSSQARAFPARLFPAGGRRSTPKLGFDHLDILREALKWLRAQLEHDGRLAASFLAGPFTIPELRRAYEAAWGAELHKRDFERKVRHQEGFLEPTGEKRAGTGGPPAALYRLGKASQLHPALRRTTPNIKR